MVADLPVGAYFPVVVAVSAAFLYHRALFVPLSPMVAGIPGYPADRVVEYPQLFFGATLAYLCFGLGSVILVRRRLASVSVQTILQATVDITMLMLLLHACGGINSGLGLMLLLPVGGLAFLLPPTRAPR